MTFKEIIKQDKYILLSFFLFSFLTLLLGTKSSPLYLINEWPDVNAYFTMGKGWVNGYIPYKDLFDHKGPLLYVIYGIGYIISNDSFTGIYILQSISFAIVLYFIYKTAHLFLSEQYAYIASLCFCLTYFATNLQGGSAEEFILVFQSIGLYLLLKHFINKDNPRNSSYIFVQGILIGCVALIKFNLIVLWVVPLLVIIIQTIIDKNFKLAIKYILFVTLGILIVIIPFIMYFFWLDALPDFWEIYIIFNSLYASAPFNLHDFSGILTRLSTIHPVIFLAFISGILYFTFNKNKIKETVFRFSFLPMFILMYFTLYRSMYHEYYIISISILSVLGIIAVLFIIQKRFNKISYWYIFISFLIVIGGGLRFKRKIMGERTNHYNFQIDFAQYMKKNSPEKDISILNLEMDQGYFLTTNTIPPNKYFYHPNIADSIYPQIVRTNIEIIKSDKAPLYLTMLRNISSENKEALPNIYLTVVESKYDAVKQYTENVYPSHFLYKRRK